MATQLLFYSEVVPVSSESHSDLSISGVENFGFASKTNSIPLVAAEFRSAASEYGIVFVNSDDTIVPIAALGLRQDENAFIGDEGQWDAAYIPAFVRRYPFAFAHNTEKNQYTLCIDEAFSGCNKEGRGERLFDTDGETTTFFVTT